MQEEQEQPKSEKKIIIRFLVIMVCSVVLGYIVGKYTHMLQETKGADFIPVWNAICSIATYILPVLYVVMHLVVATVSFAIYGKARKQAAAWDGEDEDYIEAVEARLDIPIILGNIVMVLNALLYAVVIFQAEQVEMSKLQQDILINGGNIVFFVGLIYQFVLQKLVVDLVKKLNPEKRGSVFELDFIKTWVSSCDEGQKLKQYTATYHSFRITNITCVLFWLLCFISQFMFHTGLFPTICVSVIWLTLVGTYSIVIHRLEYRRNRRSGK